MQTQVTLYSRNGCHLCDEVLVQLQGLQQEHGFRLQEIDIDQDAELREKYNHHVPVVTVNGMEALRHRWSPRRFLDALGGAD